MKNIGLGCLVVLLIFLFFGLSCTRACFRHRRYYRHYGAAICPVAPRDISFERLSSDMLTTACTHRFRGTRYTEVTRPQADIAAIIERTVSRLR